jgi:protein-S-isoprenylcysteine O-methyltransferase Ste14
MNGVVFFLCILNLALIGLLPFVFFRRDGRLNLMWWLTGTPFNLCAAVLMATLAGWLTPLVGYGTPLGRLLEWLAVLCNLASIGLICFTLGTHRVPLSLWHQDNDAPQSIVTFGAYRLMRHPFYGAYLLALLGAFLFSPQSGTAFTFAYGAIILNYTAAREEARLQASQFGEEYKTYMLQTGRFWPKWR